MSTYHGRRAPNVSHLLQDLNTIGTHDAATTEENFNMEDDLELFTNTQFYDFDSGQQTDFQAQPIKARLETAAARAANGTTEDIASAAPSAVGEMPNMDFSMTGESRDFSLPRHLHCFDLGRYAVMLPCLTRRMAPRTSTSHSHHPASCHLLTTLLFFTNDPHVNPTPNTLSCITESIPCPLNKCSVRLCAQQGLEGDEVGPSGCPANENYPSSDGAISRDLASIAPSPRPHAPTLPCNMAVAVAWLR